LKKDSQTRQIFFMTSSKSPAQSGIFFGRGAKSIRLLCQKNQINKIKDTADRTFN
jgi:hypothetical protein